MNSQLILITLSFMLLLSPAKGEDRCNKLNSLDYELFGTKTTYNDAREFLRKVNEDNLPKPFDDDPLVDEHKDLKKDSCQPVVFYFIGRHSARFPDAEDIDKYNKDLGDLVTKMAANNNQCQNKREKFLKWRSKMQSRHDNLITQLGGQEERDIARRFKKLYPEFFNSSRADIQIGVTKKIRTAQTGIEFLREVDGLRLNPACDESSTPTNDVDKPGYNLDKVLEAACYKYLMDQFANPRLEFHKQCDKISGDEKIKDPRIDRVKDPRLKRSMADRVASKLGLDNSGPKPPVTPEVLDSIFNMCKFENALENNSIWCDLFDKRDIEALEYIEDVNSYIKSAYGPKANVKQSCPLVKDLVEALEDGTKIGLNDKKKAYFYFSHADPIKKLLATFNLFKDDDSFSNKRIAEFEQDLKVPKRRYWRSSVIAPFSANLAFVLYRCQDEAGKQPKFKVLATVTEQPVKLGGCSDDTDCKLDKFLKTYGHMKDCDLNTICARRQ